MKKETEDVIRKFHKLQGGISFHKSSAPIYLEIFRKLPINSRVLDLGCGRGTLGKILNTEFPGKFQIAGIEGFEKYISQEMFEDYYKISIMDIKDYFLKSTKLLDDVYCFIDVLEHIPKISAIQIISRILSANKTVVVSIPISEKHWKQDEAYIKENKYERHLHDWTVEEIKSELNLNLVDVNKELGLFTNIRL